MFTGMGNGDGSGMIGLFIGIITSPFIIVAAAILYKRKPFRIIFYVLAAITIIPAIWITCFSAKVAIYDLSLDPPTSN
jgi:hypothetical protein